MVTESSIRLEFVGQDIIELNKITFQVQKHSPSRVSIRSRQVLGQNGIFTFNWTASVKALSIFLIHTRLSGFSAEAEVYAKFSGEEASPAASLDYAIARESNWLLDMFGLDVKGRSFAKKLIRRINPERKRPGPVVLYWDSASVPKDKILIYLNGEEIFDFEKLKALAEAISSTWKTYGSKIPSKKSFSASLVLPDPCVNAFPRPFNQPEISAFFRRILNDEIRTTLSDRTIFSINKTKELIRYLTKHPEFLPCGNDNLKLLKSLDKQDQAHDRLGLLYYRHAEELRFGLNGIRIFLPVVCVGSLAIFYFLKYFRKYNIEIVYQFAHANELLEHALGNDLNRTKDFIILGVGQTAHLFASAYAHHFEPISFMPKISFHVVSKSNGKGSKEEMSTGDYLFMADTPSSSQFYFRDLIRLNKIMPKKVAMHYMEPDQVTTAFTDADSRLKALLWFPHYHFNCSFNNCRILDTASGGINFKENFLFCHSDMGAKSKAAIMLDSAVRDAWLSLTQEPLLLELVIKMLATDVDFLRYISRVSGLHLFEDKQIGAL